MNQPSIKRLDEMWSNLVKIRDGGRCVHCGRTTYLNSHHIFSRSKKSTRWYLPNGITLCSGCHVLSSSFSAHKTPAEFMEWLKELKGETWYNALRLKANTVDKRLRSEILEEMI